MMAHRLHIKVVAVGVETKDEWISGSVDEFRSAWKGAIPCLLNSEA